MNTIELELDETGKGSFFIEDNGKRVAEMVVAVAGTNLTVYHTEVSEVLQGQGVSKDLLAAMVKYARDHQLKVIPLCRFVNAQFRRNPEQYADVWNRDWHSGS